MGSCGMGAAEQAAPAGRSCLAPDGSWSRPASRLRKRDRKAARATAAIAFAIVMAALATGCGSSAVRRMGSGSSASFYTGGAPGGTPIKGGKVVIDTAEVPVSMDPLAAGGTGNSDAVLQIAEGLVETAPGTKEVKPDLATSWTISPNGLVYTFHIRQGVQFSNGEALTGEDVVYSLERQRLPAAILGSIISPLVESVTLTGRMTVQIRLKHVSPSFLADLAFAQLGIVSKKAASHDSEKSFALHPIATGPFVLKSETTGYTTMVMVRNPHYWRAGEPYVDELVWHQVVDANARILAVRSGAATIDFSAPFSQVASLQETPGVRVLIQPSATSSSAIINDSVAPLTEADVRKALNYATPRSEIIKAVFKGLGTPANNFPTAEFKYYDRSVPAFPYDLAKAKTLLKASKVPNGFDVTVLLFSGEPNAALVASILQSAWAKIGVHVKIQAAEPTNANADVSKGQYQIFLYTPELIVQETYEPDIVDTLYFTGSPIVGSYYKSSRVTAMIKEATTTNDQAVRQRLFREVERIVNWEEAAFLPIAFVPQVNLVSKSLRGFTWPPNSFYHLRTIWLAH